MNAAMLISHRLCNFQLAVILFEFVALVSLVKYPSSEYQDWSYQSNTVCLQPKLKLTVITYTHINDIAASSTKNHTALYPTTCNFHQSDHVAKSASSTANVHVLIILVHMSGYLETSSCYLKGSERFHYRWSRTITRWWDMQDWVTWEWLLETTMLQCGSCFQWSTSLIAIRYIIASSIAII